MDSDRPGPCANLADGLAAAAALPPAVAAQLFARLDAALAAWATPASGRPDPLLTHVRHGWPQTTSDESRGRHPRPPRHDRGAATQPALPARLPATCLLGAARIKGADLLSWLELTTAFELARQGIEVPGRLLIAAARTGAKLLAAAHPGRSIELRIPGAIAVQLGDGTGPRHTRGTPPNVIETDPATLLALLDGKIGFAAAKAEHRVAASGVHADLGPLLPL